MRALWTTLLWLGGCDLVWDDPLDGVGEDPSVEVDPTTEPASDADTFTGEWVERPPHPGLDEAIREVPPGEICVAQQDLLLEELRTRSRLYAVADGFAVDLSVQVVAEPWICDLASQEAVWALEDAMEVPCGQVELEVDDRPACDVTVETYLDCLRSELDRYGDIGERYTCDDVEDMLPSFYDWTCFDVVDCLLVP